jgi:hypothetical protein
VHGESHPIEWDRVGSGLLAGGIETGKSTGLWSRLPKGPMFDIVTSMSRESRDSKGHPYTQVRVLAESVKYTGERCSRVAAIVVAIQEGSTNIWVEQRSKRSFSWGQTTTYDLKDG